MDEHLLLNIARHADSSTALSIFRAGGKSLFETAHVSGLIREIDYTDKNYFEITFRILDKDQEHDIIDRLNIVFHFDRITDNWYCQDTIQLLLSMHQHPATIMTILLKYKTYVSVAAGQGCDLYITTTKRMVFLTGLLYLQNLEIKGKIRFMTGMRVSIPTETWTPIARDWVNRHKFAAADMKCLNVRLSKGIVLPVSEIYHNCLLICPTNEKLTLSIQPEINVKTFVKIFQRHIKFFKICPKTKEKMPTPYPYNGNP